MRSEMACESWSKWLYKCVFKSIYIRYVIWNEIDKISADNNRSFVTYHVTGEESREMGSQGGILLNGTWSWIRG